MDGGNSLSALDDSAKNVGNTTTLDDLANILRGIRAELRAGNAELLRASQAANFLGIGRSTLYRMGQVEKLLQPVRTKGGRRWRRSDLLAYVANLKK